MFSSLSELIQRLDKNIFFLFNSTIKNKVLDLAFPIITKLGEDLVIIVVCILLFVLGKNKEKKTTILIFATMFITRLSVLILKHLTHRPRPFFVYENIHLIGKPVFSSFPSGHTALASAICIILCFKYRNLSFLFMLLAVLVGISRIYVGLHYPTDVMAGFILGGLTAFAVLFLEKFSGEKKT
ncbi:MAG: phosphatase PAP2 family protein [Candidatus Omnitrophota bacterium]|nr:phosphatase PAP2 family protein [Candidatus Omnitrophota bacterium]